MVIRIEGNGTVISRLKLMPEPHRRKMVEAYEFEGGFKAISKLLKIYHSTVNNKWSSHTRNSTDVTQTSILFSVKHKYKKKIKAFLCPFPRTKYNFCYDCWIKYFKNKCPLLFDKLHHSFHPSIVFQIKFHHCYSHIFWKGTKLGMYLYLRSTGHVIR